MKKEFPDNKVIQTPDIVTYLSKSDNETKREGLLFILRNDVERVTTDEQTEYVEKTAKKYFSKIDYKDIARGAPILAKDREQKLDEMFSRCRHAQLIITDRLHGMIFAAITSTPCIALKSYNHKITSSKDNFKHLGYIRYIEDVKDVEEQIKYLLNTKFEPYDNEFAKKRFIKVIKEEIKIEWGSIRFTVAISTYNVEKYVERAVKSVVNQEFDNFEIIIADDSSTDNTMEIVNKLKNDKIRVFKTEKNTGTAGETRNIAIEKARGEYIIFLDGDDTLYDNKTLAKIDKIIGEDIPEIVYLGYEDVGQGNKERISDEENSSKKARLICDVTFSVSSRCWRKEFLINNNMKFKTGMYYEDELYCLKATILSKKTKSAKIKVFKYYRNREGSVMTKPSIKKCSDWYRMLAEVVDLYEITPDEYKPYLLSFIKNENDTIPLRIRGILVALKNNEKIKLFPKRNYEFRSFFEDEN